MHAHGQRERERAAAANKSNTLTNRTIDAERLVRFYIFFFICGADKYDRCAHR